MNIFKFLQVHTPSLACRNCIHFQNDPAHIEKTYAGLTTLSSGFASVRDQDGLCGYHQLYLSARDSCPDITVSTTVPQMITLTPRWLTHLLNWIPVESGV